MKRLFFAFLFLSIASSCISTKSTIKNIDDTAIRPVIKNGMFVITAYATEPKYGIDPDYPINIGIISSKSEDAFISYFFNGLQGPNGEKIEFKKIDTCCPFPTKHSNMGAGLLFMYETNFEGSTQKKNFYFNIYEKGEIACPKGYLIKKNE